MQEEQKGTEGARKERRCGLNEREAKGMGVRERFPRLW